MAASGVSGNGSGGASDSTVALQGMYKRKERDLEARHRDEVVDIKANNKLEKDQIRADAKKHIENLQAESAEKLNAKDVQHQKEIDNIKQIYSRRIAEIKKEE